MVGKVMTIDNVERQKKYVESQKVKEAKGQGLGVVFADAFLRGMRDLGYKSPAWALAEQLDNSFQAGATTAAIRFGFAPSNKTEVKPDFIAICDDGNGMIPAMISYAVRWGGTDREDDRTGFGRYGYGLPSSAVSMARRYTVYSKVEGGTWHAVTVDIEELANASGDIKETEKLLTAEKRSLPAWVAKAAKGADTLDLNTLKSGTVIVLEDPDRLRAQGGWIKVDTLRTKLLQHFGVIYRHFIPQRHIIVDGVEAQAVDPLFLMEHGRFFDETTVKAQRVDTRQFELTTSRGTTGTVTIRASWQPPNFQNADPDDPVGRGAKHNKRFEILRDYNGLIICRGKRQVDVVQPRWTKFQNYDVNIKIEIDFDAELDEFFGITTAKQQIVITEEMWEKLLHSGKGGGNLSALVKDLRAKVDEARTELEARDKNKPGQEAPRPSSVAMESTEKFKPASPEATSQQQNEAKSNLEKEAAAKAAKSGKPKQQELKELEEATKKRRFEVEFKSVPEGPFYRPVRLGEQKRLVINTDHPFYTKIYQMAPDVSAALEVLLFVIAERELESKEQAETFYKAERQLWSERLRLALDSLVLDATLKDKASAVAEAVYMETGTNE